MILCIPTLTFSNNFSLFLVSSSSRGTSAYVQSMVALSQFSRREDSTSVASVRSCTSGSGAGSFALATKGTVHVEHTIANARRLQL